MFLQTHTIGRNVADVILFALLTIAIKYPIRFTDTSHSLGGTSAVAIATPTMESLKAVNFSFHLILFSMMALATIAAPTNSSISDVTTLNEERVKRDADVCDASVVPAAILDLRRLEQRAYCHFKVCESRYGNRRGKTRNPDTIYRVICEETAHCKQAYLTMEVTLQKDGKLQSTTEVVPVGCVYSLTDLRRSVEVIEEQTDRLD
jgi:hypothetical protein